MDFLHSIDAILRVHCDNFSTDGVTSVRDELVNLCRTCRFSVLNPFPEWFTSLLIAVQNRDHDKHYFADISSELWSLIASLESCLGWEMVDTGEDIQITLRSYGLSVFISTQGRSPQGESCCFFRIRELVQKNVDM
jgi:hypothetical protein